MPFSIVKSCCWHYVFVISFLRPRPGIYGTKSWNRPFCGMKTWMGYPYSPRPVERIHFLTSSGNCLCFKQDNITFPYRTVYIQIMWLIMKTRGYASVSSPSPAAFIVFISSTFPTRGFRLKHKWMKPYFGTRPVWESQIQDKHAKWTFIFSVHWIAEQISFF